ncbi:hypothetical protein GTZ89_17045 [Streptomyces sp. SID8382]|uniref:hypothetical protein n=1 Tax=Streptomyces malaysiensis TaxID=92644 RepID=UPI000CA2DC8E|nr:MULTISPECIES: hypothetical protein [unclassified Streptomyces]AUA16508.1 hypothetical protein CFP59_08699 [Streptomyces sp. M56]MYX57347.1 hypothetical protein [Streptomyces sp. SID8382]
MAHASLCTDHPGWTDTESGRPYRMLSNERGSTWMASWDGHALDFMPMTGNGSLPDLTYTHRHRLPQAAPRQLTNALSTLGTLIRISNPSLWDALCAAILRQGQSAPHAGRQLYRRLCTLYGPALESPLGTLHLAPTPKMLLSLPDHAFHKAKAAVAQASLRSAAHAYLTHADSWKQLKGRKLVTALRSIHRIGTWTAAAAAADYRGDFTLYPLHDFTLRSCAHNAAPDAGLPVEEEPFARQWTAWATTPGQLRTLTLATLAFGSHAPASTTLAQ